MDRILRALVVDDSAYVRKVIKQMLGRSPFIDVVGAARSAEEALTLVDELRPDVVTLDLIMPAQAASGLSVSKWHNGRCRSWSSVSRAKPVNSSSMLWTQARSTSSRSPRRWQRTKSSKWPM